MSEASEKQISYATSLGIENPSQYSKETLKKLISGKLGGTNDSKPSYPKNNAPAPSNGVIGATQGVGEVRHFFQSEYEFGPAGNRHKIKYFTVEELKQKMKEIEEDGLFVPNETI